MLGRRHPLVDECLGVNQSRSRRCDCLPTGGVPVLRSCTDGVGNNRHALPTTTQVEHGLRHTNMRFHTYQNHILNVRCDEVRSGEAHLRVRLANPICEGRLRGPQPRRVLFRGENRNSKNLRGPQKESRASNHAISVQNHRHHFCLDIDDDNDRILWVKTFKHSASLRRLDKRLRSGYNNLLMERAPLETQTGG